MDQDNIEPVQVKIKDEWHLVKVLDPILYRTMPMSRSGKTDCGLQFVNIPVEHGVLRQPSSMVTCIKCKGSVLQPVEHLGKLSDLKVDPQKIKDIAAIVVSPSSKRKKPKTNPDE